MDEDYGTQYADKQADDQYYAEQNMCPDCETKYDDNGYCQCEVEL